MNLSSLSYLLILVLPLVFFIFWKLNNSGSKSLPLPPGPRPWPIVGNLFQLAKVKKLHITMAEFAKLYGPLISVRLGTQLVVVASSPRAAIEILKTHDRLLSGRHAPKLRPLKDVDDFTTFSLVWAHECHDYWKLLRSLCRAELFSVRSIEQQGTIRQRKMDEMVKFLCSKEGEVVNIAQLVFTTVFNILSNLFFSRCFLEFEDEEAGELKGLIRKMMELGTTPNVAEFYPFLDGIDIQGLNKKSREYHYRIIRVWESIINERREKPRSESDEEHPDFLDVMLQNDFSDDQIHPMAIELFVAGTDTTTSTIEWAMAELIRSKETMNRVQEELIARKELNYDKSELPYLHMCVRETLRLHPPVPFLVPHRAIETCEVMNYRIPKDAKVLVNVWAIGRDPTCWDDPLSFRPERFLNSKLEFKGNDFEFIPFGAGRRICPGLPMAAKTMELVLATLIHYFDWSLPSGQFQTKLDVNEKFGVTLQKEKPLLLIPTLKFPYGTS